MIHSTSNHYGCVPGCCQRGAAATYHYTGSGISFVEVEKWYQKLSPTNQSTKNVQRLDPATFVRTCCLNIFYATTVKVNIYQISYET